jgi:hypothetical protein
MRFKTPILVAFCCLILLPFGRSQVYDQAKLFKLLPQIPSNLSTATEEEVNAFRIYCDSIDAILTRYEEKYSRAPNAETNTDLIMEYYDIRDTITDLHSTQRSKYYDLAVMFSDLEFELSSKNDSINELIENIKYDNSKREEVQALQYQIYANKVECSQKQAAIYLQFLQDYRNKVNNLAEKANKSEVLPLPSHLNKNISYVLMNVKRYLNYLSEVYRFNIGPNSN